MTFSHRRLLIAAAFAVASLLGATLQLGCSSGSSSSTPPAPIAAPSGLGYGTNPASYRRGVAIAANAPHSSGGAVASYSVAPALPAGLALNASTGVISGTPTAITPQATYTVTAANAGGSSSCAVVVTVTDAPPAQLAYDTPQGLYTKGVAIPANTPASTGGAVTGYAVSPALPTGLSLSPATGVISGTPTAVVAHATYTVTASNSGGSTACDLEITVKDVAPSALAYAANPATYFLSTPIAANTPSNLGGVLTTYWVAPALPAGLLLNAATGAITGTPLATAQGTYRVTASNSGGSATCDLVLTVIAAPPANLTYAANPVTAYKGLAMTPALPSSTGGPVVSYSVVPALPAGLGLDPATGAVSGVPGAITPTATYVVTATNTGGSTSANLVLTVKDQAPAALTYTTNPSSYTLGTAIQPNVPSNAGGAITTYSVSPALPAGLSLDATTGVISGTPTVLSAPATYLVTGGNATGSTTCNLLTSVVGAPIAPPATPVVATVTYATAGKAGYQATTQDQGTADGMGYVWTLSNGTLTGGQGTPAITFTAGAVGALTVQVKATNLGGSATGVQNVSVEAAPTAQLFAQDQALYGSAGVQASVPPQPGMTYLWTLSGAGAITAGTDPVAAYTTGLAPGGYQLTVNVQNLAGEQASSTRNLAVVGDAFLPQAASAPQRRLHSATTLKDGRILVAGGYDPKWVTATAALYDPYSGTWAPVAPLAAARAGHTATLLLDGRVLVTGGVGDDPNLTPLSSAELYDPATRTWSSAGTLSVERSSHTATRLADGTVLVAGGVPILTDTSYDYLNTAEIYDPATNSWSDGGTLSLRRARHTATLLANGKVMLAGGETSVQDSAKQQSVDLFDPATLTWTAGPNMPGSRYGHSANLLANGKVLVAGGHGSAPGNSATLFDPGANGGAGAWSATLNTMTTGRYFHQSVRLANGQILVVSGSDAVTSGKVVASAELFDPATSRWTDAGSMLFARTGHAVALLPDGRVLAFGGDNGASTAVLHANAEVYDPAQNLWTQAGGLAGARSSHTTTLLGDGTLLVTGGAGAGGALAVTERFDPATGGWSIVGSLISARYWHGAALLATGDVLVAGGFGASSSLASAELYSPSTRTWSAAAPMATARREHTLTRLANGKVLATGGYSSTYVALATAELYDPATGTWTPAGSLGSGRYEHTATLLASGKVLITGGRQGNTLLSSAELYDPATNTWSPAPAMSLARQFHAATLLPDDKVLVTGGQINGSLFTATAEVYDAAANAWTVLAPMNGVRGGHAATLLPDQQVLVTGGDGGPYGPAIATVERYNPATNVWSSAGGLVAPRKNHTASVVGGDGTVLVVGGKPSATPEVWKP